MESTIGGNQQASPDNSAQQSVPPRPKDYEDVAESLDSKLKAKWDEKMGDLKNNYISYRKAFVLLLSWDESFDDLHTDKEVSKWKVGHMQRK